MGYKRLTKRNGEVGIIALCNACKRKATELCMVEESEGMCCIDEELERLAELEDKIEQGTLIEFPRIDIYVDYCYGLEKYVVQWQVNGIIKRKTFWSEKKAEKKLKELQNG